MKAEIREFFVENLSFYVEAGDISLTEQRSERYAKMQKHYMDLVEKNECKCFNTVEDILKELKAHLPANIVYLIGGK